MADNTTLSVAAGTGDTYRSKDRGTAKTSIVALDLNPSGPETLMAGYIPSRVTDGTNYAALFQSHNADNQSLGGGTYAMNTGGVAQLLNPAGNVDRQRGTGFDGIPAAGVASGAQQFAVPFSTTIAASIPTGSQTVTPASMTNIQVGSYLRIANSNGTNAETVYVSATTGATFTATFSQTKTGPGITVNGFIYNQARDASIGDNVALIGLSASATYLYNAISGNVELDRSASGELDGATGKGTAVATEYEYNGGGPVTNAGITSGLNYDRARNLQAKGLGSATQNSGGAAGTSSITVSSAAATNTLSAGQQIRIDRNTGTEECAYVATSYTPGTAAIPLQSALAYTHSGATVEWDIFAAAGPGTSGFTPCGIGIEDEAIFNPADGKYYIARAANADGMAVANIVAECSALWNGTTFDRPKSASANPTSGTGVVAVANGVAPLQSLNAQSTVNTVGTALDNGVARANHSLFAVTSAGVSAGVVTLMGSNDGINYVATATTITTSAASTPYAAALASFPFRYVTAKITTAITGGTVTAYVASC